MTYDVTAYAGRVRSGAHGSCAYAALGHLCGLLGSLDTRAAQRLIILIVN